MHCAEGGLRDGSSGRGGIYSIHDIRQPGCRYRLGIVVALNVVASEFDHALQLLLCFHSFNNRGDTKRACHQYYGID